MVLDYLAGHIWVSVGIWVPVYVGDYALTLVGARLWRSAPKHVVYEGGYELTPEYRDDIAALRLISPRLVEALVWSSAFLAVCGIAAVSNHRPVYFEALLGAYLLLEAAIYIRHVGTIAFSYGAANWQGVSGHLVWRRWFAFWCSAIELVAFAGLFVVLFVLSGRWFFAGGAFSCLLTGLRDKGRASKERMEGANAPPAADESGAYI